jgi:RecA-family ATPase
MPNKPSHSANRIALAQFLLAHSIELEDLYQSLGLEIKDANPAALAHIAGVLDGMNIASAHIREMDVEQWSGQSRTPRKNKP